MKRRVTSFVAVAGFLSCVVSSAGHATAGGQDRIRSAVDRAIRPMMAKYDIPGMAVGLVADGGSFVFDYGVASRESGKPVTRDTLFELGSVSKTLTATLASYAQAGGEMSLSDKVGKYLPSLRNSRFGDLSLLNLGTHTPGGLPLQVPDGIRTDDALMRYFRSWRPTYEPGTYRTYSNPGVGAFGLIAARSMGQDFVTLMEKRLFPALGMKNSYITVPNARIADYAQGYTKRGAPIRMAPGVVSAEAYGIKTTAADMARFIEANMAMITLDERLQRAIMDTHTGYFQAGVMTQDLIWEQYPYPVALQTLLKGNGPTMIFKATPVTRLGPPQKPRDDVWINKTGSTNGFGSYVAFVPEKRLGIVILANRNFPIEARVTAASEILETIAGAAR